MKPVFEAPKWVQVLNGTVVVGDTVAFAVRDGNLAALRLGKVVALEARKIQNRDVPRIRLRIQVSRSSTATGDGAVFSSMGQAPRGSVVGIEILDRVVKINPRPEDSYPILDCIHCGSKVRRTIAGWTTMEGDGYSSHCPSGTEDSFGYQPHRIAEFPSGTDDSPAGGESDSVQAPV